MEACRQKAFRLSSSISCGPRAWLRHGGVVVLSWLIGSPAGAGTKRRYPRGLKPCRHDSRRPAELYRLMRLNRTVEERLVRLYRQGKVLGGLYRCLGRGRTASPWPKATSSGPLIRTSGGAHRRLLAARHLCAAPRAGNLLREAGRQLHFGTPETGMIAPISMLGALVAVSGVALGARMRRTQAVAMT